MEPESRGSVSHWLSDLKQGDSAAAQNLWNRYFSQLVRVAEGKLRTLSREADGEDVALSALKSVMIGVREDRYPQLDDRTNLWPLLVTITARKAITEVRRQQAQKRAKSATVPLANVHEVVGQTPRPEFALQVADELERLVKLFDDPNLALIATRKLEGATHEEIAAALGCSTKTIIRKLNRIRREWEEDAASRFPASDP